MSTATLPAPPPVQTQPAERIPRSDLPPGHPPFAVYRFSVEQYHAMIEHGILDENDRIELLEGWMATGMPKNPIHSMIVAKAGKRISRDIPAGWYTRPQEPVTTDDGEPEPDLAVVRGDDESAYIHKHPGPTDVGALVEVADSSLQADRTTKAVTYARANIPIYWIVNLPNEQVEVYSDPTGPAAAPRYQTLTTYHRGESVPLVLDGAEVGQIAVGDLLP